MDRSTRLFLVETRNRFWYCSGGRLVFAIALACLAAGVWFAWAWVAVALLRTL